MPLFLVMNLGSRQQSANNNQPIIATMCFVCLFAECVRELVRLAQGSGYVATLASGTLGIFVQSDPVRAAVLEGIVRTDTALPGMSVCLVSNLQTLVIFH